MNNDNAILKTWFFVINPVSGKGKALGIWQQINSLLMAHDIPFQYAISNYHRHTEVLVSEFVQSGGRRIVGVGGDGTLNEIVNGVFTALSIDRARQCLISLLPVGTGNDWVKSQRTKLSIHNLITRLKTCQLERHAVGMVHLNSEARYFVNVAGSGIDGSVVRELEKANAGTSKIQLAYLQGLLKGIRNFQAKKSTITLHAQTVLEKPMLLAAASIGKYFGGGMKISPDASFTSGELDLTVVEKVPNWKLFPQIYKLFTGQIGSVPFVYKQHGKTLHVTSDSPLPIQADGEYLGEAKHIQFSIIPGGINVLC